MLSYRPNELRAAFPEQPVRHQELRRAPMSTHHGIKCSVRMPNVMDAPPFKAGASTRTLSSSEVQVRLGGIESNDRGTKIRSRGCYHASPAADVEDSLTPTDTGKFQKRPRQTVGPASHKHFVSRGVIGHKRDHFIRHHIQALAVASAREISSAL